METNSTHGVLDIPKLDLRRLDPSEYGELAKIEEGYVPDPDHSIVVVAKECGEIVARTMLIRPWHIEGTWVHERFRGGTTGYRLLRQLECEAKKIGLPRLFSYAAEASIENYLERLGYTKAPLTVWMKDI
jgi:hypothetical protein